MIYCTCPARDAPERAVSPTAPSMITSILLARANAIKRDMIIIMAGIFNIDAYTPANPPIEKEEYDAITSGSNEPIVLIKALKSAFTATPARIRERDDDTLFVKDEIKNTIETARREPRNATSGSSENIFGKSDRKRSTDAPAPELIPMMFGLESPFPVALWIRSPEREKASPERNAAKTLGRRREKNTMLSTLPKVNSLETSILTLPMKSERKKMARRTKRAVKAVHTNFLSIDDLFHHPICIKPSSIRFKMK